MEKNIYKIPENIQKEINEKWFFVYNWIDEQEIKTSIQIDFLEKLYYASLPILIIFGAIWFFVQSSSKLLILTIWWLIGFLSIIMIIYLIIISIKITLKAWKISHLIITNKYFSINKKILELQDWNKIILDKETQKIWETFHEELFKNSELKEKKDLVFKSLIKKSEENFYTILKFAEDIDKRLTALVYIIFAAFWVASFLIYIVWIFFAAILWIFINFAIRKYLIFKWNKILKINEDFKEIEKFSINLINEKEILQKNLFEASENEWKDGLLLKINSWIEKVNKNANNSVNKNLELIKELKASDFDKIFDYNLYNSWLKKQIATPIIWIIELLEKNIKVLDNQIFENEKIVQNTENINNQNQIIFSIERLKSRKNEIEKHIFTMKSYLEKLI